jgi:hypothetical protein
MPRFLVRVPYCVWVSIEVDADDAEQAQEAAWDHVGLRGFCGNGGTNKLVGVSGENVSVEACEEPLDFEGLSVEVEAV